MSDWADEMADEIFDKLFDSLGNRKDGYGTIKLAEALRSVERRTAEECIDIVTDSHTMGEWDGDCRRGIRERFGLEESK